MMNGIILPIRAGAPEQVRQNRRSNSGTGNFDAIFAQTDSNNNRREHVENQRQPRQDRHMVQNQPQRPNAADVSRRYKDAVFSWVLLLNFVQ